MNGCVAASKSCSAVSLRNGFTQLPKNDTSTTTRLSVYPAHFALAYANVVSYPCITIAATSPFFKSRC